LAVTARSLRLVPPLLGLCVYLSIFMTQGNQGWSSIVAVDVVAAFALALWASVAHTGALSRGHREITQVAVGRPVAFAAELTGSAIVGLGTGVVIVVLPWALGRASSSPTVGQLASALAVAAVAALTGAAAGQVLDGLSLRAPARFVVAIGLVTVTVARPAITVVVSWVVPPVMDLAKAVNDQRPGGAVWWSVMALAWTVVAVVTSYVAGGRFPATDRTS
jgi:hypothetical protein